MTAKENSFLNLNNLKDSSYQSQKKTISLRDLNKDSVPEIKSSTPSKQTEKIESSSPEISKVNRRLFTLILIILTLFALAFIYFMGKKQGENFHIGKWKSEIIPQERELGVESINYEITENSIYEQTQSDLDGVESLIKIRLDYSFISKENILINIKLNHIEIQELIAQIPNSLCPDSPDKCKEIGDKFKSELKTKLENDFQNQIGKIIKLRKLNNNQIQIESELETKVLNK